jgi:hypothetical protein
VGDADMNRTLSLRRTLAELAVDAAAFAVVSLIAARQLVRAGTRVAYGLAADAAGWAERYSKDGGR